MHAQINARAHTVNTYACDGGERTNQHRSHLQLPQVCLYVTVNCDSDIIRSEMICPQPVLMAAKLWWRLQSHVWRRGKRGIGEGETGGGGVGRGVLGEEEGKGRRGEGEAGRGVGKGWQEEGRQGEGWKGGWGVG